MTDEPKAKEAKTDKEKRETAGAIGLLVIIALVALGWLISDPLEDDATRELMALFREHQVYDTPICGTDASQYRPERGAGSDFFEDGYIYCKEAFGSESVWPPKYAFGDTEDGFFLQTQSGKSQTMLARAGIRLECWDGGTQTIKHASLISDATVTFKCHD